MKTYKVEVNEQETRKGLEAMRQAADLISVNLWGSIKDVIEMAGKDLSEDFESEEVKQSVVDYLFVIAGPYIQQRFAERIFEANQNKKKGINVRQRN
jgi:hypothetical protein